MNLIKKQYILPSVLIFLGACIIAAVSPVKAIGIFVAIAMIALTIARPEWMLLFLAALIPFEPFLLKWVPGDLYVFARYSSEVLLYALFLVAFFRTVFSNKSFGPKSIIVPFAFLIVTALASWAINFTPPHVAVLGIRQIIRFILLVFIAYQLQCSSLFIKRLLMMLGGIVCFESILGILQWLSRGALDSFLLPTGRRVFAEIQLTTGTTQFWEEGQRVFGTLGRYDQLGTFLCLAMLLFAGIFFEKRNKHADPSASVGMTHGADQNIGIQSFVMSYVIRVTKNRPWLKNLFTTSIFTLGGLALVLTYSRASWFGFALGLFVIGVIVKRSKLLTMMYAGIAALVLISILASWSAITRFEDVPRQSIGHRLLEAFSMERWRGEYRGLGRVFFLIHTPTDVVSKSPLFGLGPGSYGAGTAAALHFTESYERAGVPFGIYGTEGYIDNNWFSLWGELGTIGVAAYLALIAVLVRAAWSVYTTSADPLMRGIALGYLGVTAAVVFQAFLATYLEVRTLAFYYWLVGGILLAHKTETHST